MALKEAFHQEKVYVIFSLMKDYPALTTMTGYFLDSDDSYIYLGKDLNEVTIALVKSDVKLITTAEEYKDLVTQ